MLPPTAHAATARPPIARSLYTVLIDTSATRLIERIDEPSQSIDNVRRKVANVVAKARPRGQQSVGQIEVDLALAFAEDALVLERGRIAFRGKAAELQEDESLQHRLLAIGER